MPNVMKIKIGLEKEFEIDSNSLGNVTMDEIGCLLKYFCNLAPDTRHKFLHMISGAYLLENPGEATNQRIIEDFFNKK